MCNTSRNEGETIIGIKDRCSDCIHHEICVYIWTFAHKNTDQQLVLEEDIYRTTPHCGYLLKVCPFCGGSEIDAKGVKDNNGKTSPQCMTCGATAESEASWNNRKEKP